MALTEETKFDVNVLSTGHLEVRRVDLVLRDGVEIARTNHRHVVTPGEDTSKQPKLVKDIAKTVWTKEVLAAQKEREAAALAAVVSDEETA